MKWIKSPFLQAAGGFLLLVLVVRGLNFYYENEDQQNKFHLQQELDSLQMEVDSLKNKLNKEPAR